MSSETLKKIFKDLETLKLCSSDDVDMLEKIKMKVLSFERTSFIPLELSIDKRKYKVPKEFKENQVPYLAKPKPKLIDFMDKYYPGDGKETLYDLSHLAKWSLSKMRADKKKKRLLYDFGNEETFKGCGFLNQVAFCTGIPDISLIDHEEQTVSEEGPNVLKFEETEEKRFGKSFRRVASSSAKVRFSDPMDHLYLFERMYYTKMSYTKFFPVIVSLIHGRKKEKKETYILFEKSKVTRLKDYADCDRENHLVSTFKDRLRALFKMLNHDPKDDGKKNEDWEDSFQDAGHIVAVSSSAQDTISFTNSEHECMIEAFSQLKDYDFESLADEKEKKKWDKAKILKDVMLKEKQELFPSMRFPSEDKNYLCFLNGILQDAQVNQVYYRNIEKLIQKIRGEFKEFEKCEVLIRHDQFYSDELKKYFPYLEFRKWNYDNMGLVSKTIPNFFLVTVMTMNTMKSKKINEIYIFFVPNSVNKYFVHESCREVTKERTYFPNDKFKKFSCLKNPKDDVEIYNWIIDRAYRFGLAMLPQKIVKKKKKDAEEVEGED